MSPSWTPTPHTPSPLPATSVAGLVMPADPGAVRGAASVIAEAGRPVNLLVDTDAPLSDIPELPGIPGSLPGE